MCLLVIATQQVAGCPLFLAANREEWLSRQSAPPALNEQGQLKSTWLGGSDLVAGGTWLGVNQWGLVITVTNRPKRDVPAMPVSRGLLCRDLLACLSARSAFDTLLARLGSESFAGFNMAILSGGESWIVEAGDEIVPHRLEAGIHAITNGGLNNPRDGRINRAREELRRRTESYTSVTDWLAAAKVMCALRAEDGQPALSFDPALLVEGHIWGTVSSTVLAMTKDCSQARYLFSPGPPSSVAYDDYSNALRALLVT